jgi:hypothetical protein
MKLLARVVCVSLLVCACSSTPTESPSAPSAPSAPSPTESPSNGPSASATPALSATAWNAVYANDGARLYSVIAGPDGFMASGCLVGEGGDCEQAIVVLSSDGDSWTTTVVDPIADLFAPSVRRVDGRFFALGFGHYGGGGGAMVWTSVDGRDWSRVEAPSFRDRAVDDVIESPFGTFAVGHEAPIDSDNTSGFLLWPVHADGSFGEPRSIDLGDGQKIASGAIWTGREFVAWAWPRWDAGETTVLRSRDGQTWTVRSTITKPAEHFVSEILAVGDRLIAVGYSSRAYPLTPRAWVSDDRGRSWTRASVEGTDGRIAHVTSERGSLVARGVAPSLDGSPASWRSIDGMSWTRTPDDDDMPALAGFRSSVPASIGNLACVAGTFEDDIGPRGAIYCTER